MEIGFGSGSNVEVGIREGVRVRVWVLTSTVYPPWSLKYLYQESLKGQFEKVEERKRDKRHNW